MNTLLKVLMICFYLGALFGCGISLYLIVTNIRNYLVFRRNSKIPDIKDDKRSIEQSLATLAGKATAEEYADAFGWLIQGQYVLVHILHNRGNYYDDKIQPGIYRQSLTPTCVKRLMTLEGQDERHLF